MCSASARAVERFAPSPTGPLHLGHAFSALTAWDAARAAGGTFLLRIEDIDRGRGRPEWEARIVEDLRWLDIAWPEPVLRQSERLPAYRAALDGLWQQGLLYPCRCSRSDIAGAASAPQEGARTGPDGILYPGTCRARPLPRAMPDDEALRLDMRRAMARIGDASFTELAAGAGGARIGITAPEMIRACGDVVLARRAMGTSYHLAVVLDDAAQGVTHVTRGEDLLEAAKIHVVLQRLLGLPTPLYRHHRLIRDAAGKRLSKRDDARAIAKYRAEGASPADIRRMVGLPVP